jgi:hypothetical protein
MHPVCVVEPLLRTMMDIRALRISLPDRPVGPFGSPDHGCAGETVPHLLFLSQTSTGLYNVGRQLRWFLAAQKKDAKSNKSGVQQMPMMIPRYFQEMALRYMP